MPLFKVVVQNRFTNRRQEYVVPAEEIPEAIESARQDAAVAWSQSAFEGRVMSVSRMRAKLLAPVPHG